MLRPKSLLEKCKRGNRKALRAFYTMHKRDIFYTILKYCRREEDAKDILQDSFIQIFRDLYQFDPERASLKTWMNRVAINCALRYNHKNYPPGRHQVDFDDLDLVEEQVDVNKAAYSTREILKMLQDLPDGYRSVFNLYVMEGYTHQEIAEYLGVSVGTSKSQLSKAKAMLRGFLQKRKPMKITALL